jgi:phospholipid/cholesterol/gamma-HCH transport system substrate-binding protein
MKKRTTNSVKLGIFVLTGLAFLILTLYMIGRNKNLFGSTFSVKTQFANVQGLVAGNNVRYAGIEIGTVKRIYIINDTLVEVLMVVDEDMRRVIRTNAVASIGSDGLMGNKVINIAAGRGEAAFVHKGDVLVSRQPIDMDEMLRTLERTNTDVGVIAVNLKNLSSRLNTSSGLLTLLDDKSMPQNLKAAAANVQAATASAVDMARDLETIVSNIKEGKGSLGTLLTDTTFARNLNDAVLKMKTVGDQAETLATSIQSAVAEIQYEIGHGKGTVSTLLKDSAMAQKLNNSLENIEKGTDAFNQNMEALKHNFLFRGYFRKIERQKQKSSGNKVASH